MNVLDDVSAHAGAAEHSTIGAFRSFLGFGYAFKGSRLDAGHAFEFAAAVSAVCDSRITIFIVQACASARYSNMYFSESACLVSWGGHEREKS